MGTRGHVDADDVVDDLARTLFAVDEGSLTTASVTALITDVIVSWALRRGWWVRREARVGVPVVSEESARLGFVDVLVGGADGPCLAIEIDSSDKTWSVTKLRHAAAAGMRPIWVRWGDEALAVEHRDVDVIQLAARRRTAKRQGREGQLSLWP